MFDIKVQKAKIYPTRRAFNFSETNDIYDSRALHERVENDEISTWEEGFMTGYLET